MSARLRLPAGWSMERLGLISGVRFRKDNLTMLWTPEGWTTSVGGHFREAHGVPPAATQDEAVRIGTAWIVDFEKDEPT